MTLEKKFETFCQDKELSEEKPPSKVKEILNETQKFIIFNRDKIDIAMSVAKSLTAFAIHKTPFTLLEGAVDAIKTFAFDKSFYADDFFSEPNGWKLFTYDGMSFSGIFSSVLNKFPSQSLRFEYDNNSVAKLITLPFCKVGIIKSDVAEKIFYKFNEINVDLIIEYLIAEKLKELETNIISVEFSSPNENRASFITLVPEVIFPIDSLKASVYTDYIKKCLDLNINRSLMFYGPPGTGKTTTCQTIIKNLGFRTLKFRYTDEYNFNLFAFIVRKFKIEAVIIDDLDQMDSRDELFEFLEMLKKETKLVIGLVNSLKEFHPALLRPGRFDEIITIDALDPKIVKNIIGPKLSRKYFNKVKNWPIAYINEFCIRSKILTAIELDAACKELHMRVKKALQELS